VIIRRASADLVANAASPEILAARRRARVADPAPGQVQFPVHDHVVAGIMARLLGRGGPSRVSANVPALSAAGHPMASDDGQIGRAGVITGLRLRVSWASTLGTGSLDYPRCHGSDSAANGGPDDGRS
jgi:hypothetical protein